MTRQDNNNHELDDLLASSNIQDTWKANEEQSKKKSIQFIILRDLLIILGFFGMILFLVWNICHNDAGNEGNHPIQDDGIQTSIHDEKQAVSSKTCKELLKWRIESVDSDKPMILPRLQVRLDEMLETDGVVTYEQRFSTLDSQIEAELSQNIADPYKYFVKLSKVTWTFPDDSCKEDNSHYQELLFKKESAAYLYKTVVSYMKEYHASITQGDSICITVTSNRGDNRLTLKDVETTLKMDDNKKKKYDALFQ